MRTTTLTCDWCAATTSDAPGGPENYGWSTTVRTIQTPKPFFFLSLETPKTLNVQSDYCPACTTLRENARSGDMQLRDLLRDIASLLNREDELWDEGCFSTTAAKRIGELRELREKAFVLLGINK